MYLWGTRLKSKWKRTDETHLMARDKIILAVYERHSSCSQGKGGASMKVICAWCKKFLRMEKGSGTSHGICSECHKKQLDELKKRKR